MANNRFYMYCPICKRAKYLGKTMGGGIYTTNDETDELKSIYAWMDKHMEECYDSVAGVYLPDEIFQILAEHDERIGYHRDRIDK